MKKQRIFKSVFPSPGHCLDVMMETGSRVSFDFTSRLQSFRFSMLLDEDVFNSVHTDGFFLLFEKGGREVMRIAAADFTDLLMIDRTK